MHRNWSFALAAASVSTLMSFGPAHADGLNVVASIKPVHSLVAGVMGDTAAPHLLVSGADSPHTYSMRPSDAEALSDADVVFWVGEELETFLERPIGNLGTNARAVSLIDSPGMTLLDFRDDDDHGHESEHDAGHADEHAEKHDEDHDGHEHEEAGDHHSDDEEHAHHHTGLDPHVWLDPANARAMVAEIVAVLSEADAANAETYRRNGEDMTARLLTLEAETQTALMLYQKIPYFTFHESFGYFDNRFGLDSHGAISISPERQPGAQRLREIRSELAEHGRVCVFSEPQFPPKLVDIVVEGTAARTGTLDPLGAALEPGSALYFSLIEQNRDAFTRCFQETM
jgi:zinc transport system substrate-binding protein